MYPPPRHLLVKVNARTDILSKIVGMEIFKKEAGHFSCGYFHEGWLEGKKLKFKPSAGQLL